MQAMCEFPAVVSGSPIPFRGEWAQGPNVQEVNKGELRHCKKQIAACTCAAQQVLCPFCRPLESGSQYQQPYPVEWCCLHGWPVSNGNWETITQMGNGIGQIFCLEWAASSNRFDFESGPSFI